MAIGPGQGTIMHPKTIRTALFAVGLAAASLGFTAPAQAVAAAGAFIVENAGSFTLVNNSFLEAYQFVVTNPAAASGATDSTTQRGWTSTVCDRACATLISAGFVYTSSSAAFDILPGQSSSKFFFNASPASSYVISLRNANGTGLTTISGTAVPGTAVPGVPEPATWALMMVGMGAAGSMLRRRRAGARATVSV